MGSFSPPAEIQHTDTPEWLPIRFHPCFSVGRLSSAMPQLKTPTSGDADGRAKSVPTPSLGDGSWGVLYPLLSASPPTAIEWLFPTRGVQYPSPNPADAMQDPSCASAVLQLQRLSRRSQAQLQHSRHCSMASLQHPELFDAAERRSNAVPMGSCLAQPPSVISQCAKWLRGSGGQQRHFASCFSIRRAVKATLYWCTRVTSPLVNSSSSGHGSCSARGAG